jgi:hypothetical protein
VARTVKEYCSEVCGGKCCTNYDDNVTCCHLNEEKLCDAYEHRFGEGSLSVETVFVYIGKNNKMKSFQCGRIEDIIRAGGLRKDIEDQCCIAHPELLEE